MLTSRYVGIGLIHANRPSSRPSVRDSSVHRDPRRDGGRQTRSQGFPISQILVPEERAITGSSGAPSTLLHDFVGIDAPQVAALDPSGIVGGFDAAPVGAALEQPRDNPGFGAGNGR